MRTTSRGRSERPPTTSGEPVESNEMQGHLDHEHRVTSTRFPIDETERAHAPNPGVYGRALAHFIAAGLRERGVSVGDADVFPEDWGWCVAAQGKPVAVYVGCSNVRAPDEPVEAADVPGEDVEWLVFTFAERGLLGRLLRRDDGSSDTARVHALVGEILGVESPSG